jgi:hypothetical protein
MKLGLVEICLEVENQYVSFETLTIAMKLFLLLLCSFACQLVSFSQHYNYDFVVVGVNEPAEAKKTINEIRDFVGVTVIYFKDETDQFTIYTHLNYEIEELGLAFSEMGLELIGPIVKTNVE